MMGPGTPHFSEGLSPVSSVSGRKPRPTFLRSVAPTRASSSPTIAMHDDSEGPSVGRRRRRRNADQGDGEAGDGKAGAGGPGAGRRAAYSRRRESDTRRPLGEVAPVTPGTVTALHERRAGSSRYIVSIDGKPAATISSEAIGSLGLRVGLFVDESLAESLREAAGRVEVFDKAITWLAARARSERDLRTRLKLKGATEANVSAAIERLLSLGLLNDEAFARGLAHSRVVGGGVSKRRIGQELQRRGVSRRVADEAIDATLEEVDLDECGAAQAVAEQRLRSLRALDDATRRRRLYAFLARRGYPHDVIAKVLRSVL